MKYIKYLDKHLQTSLEGKTIVITGGNSGIGFNVSRYSAYYHMNIIWGCRNLAKANEAKEELLKEFPDAKISIFELDLASLASIKDFALKLSNSALKLDYFYHNAGVYYLDKNDTKDGLDLVIGTNYFGTYYLNELVVDYLTKTSQQTKIIFTTSLTARLGKIRYDDFQMDKNYHKNKVYFVSKKMVSQLFYYETKQNPSLSFMLVHPGATYTPLISKGFKSKAIRSLGCAFMKIFFHSPEKAALCTMLSLDNSLKNKMVCPRGLFHISGYPKICFPAKKVLKNYEQTICQTKEILSSIK